MLHEVLQIELKESFSFPEDHTASTGSCLPFHRNVLVAHVGSP